MSKADEPAFPTKAVTRTEEGVEIEDCIGLTKREYFAGLAMQGIIQTNPEKNRYNSFKQLAEDSIQMADALLAELEKPNG